MPEKIAAAAAGSFAGHFMLPRSSPCGARCPSWVGWALSLGTGQLGTTSPCGNFLAPKSVFTAEGEEFAIILPVNLGSILLFLIKPVKFC